MDLKTIAEELVRGCREGTDTANLDRLYAPDAVSVEAAPMPGTDSAEMHGLEAIKGKHAWWNATYEALDGGEIDGPYLHGTDRFAVIFAMRTRHRETGEESDMKEVAVYHVSNGQIVREEFFYG